MPAAMSLASIGLFDLSLPPSATSLQDPEVLLPLKWTGHLARRLSRWPTGLVFALVWAALPRSHFGVSLVLLWHCLGHSFVLSQRIAPAAVFAAVLLSLHSGASISCLASPFAQGTNASDLAAAAFSASLACSTPAVPSARPGATLPFVHARQPRGFDFTRDRDRDCVCKPKGVRTSGVTMQDMCVVRC